ncbi:MarR family winged helix-turn-helix transcriptional regulator [Sinomonas sp.]|uniref:MarR family winged helix-turn-helix transcriptional regulator n=1 Tax=Sinomonas sp. TaxID=1914986 RepID=UPI003F7F00E3
MAADLRALLRHVNRRLRQQADFGDLTRSQLNVLSLLEREGPATVSDLARAEGVRPQSMGATVAALEEAGLVRREPDPADRRKSSISLSEVAREQIAAKRLVRQDWLQRALSRELSPGELERVSEALVLLSRIVNNP